MKNPLKFVVCLYLSLASITIRLGKYAFYDILALAKTTPANKPNSMLNRFGRLRGTLKSTRPASDIGTLFNEPTKLYVVGPV